MKVELLVYQIEEHLNKNFLIEKRNKKNNLTNALLQKTKRSDLDDKEQKNAKMLVFMHEKHGTKVRR